MWRLGLSMPKRKSGKAKKFKELVEKGVSPQEAIQEAGYQDSSSLYKQIKKDEVNPSKPDELEKELQTSGLHRLKYFMIHDDPEIALKALDVYFQRLYRKGSISTNEEETQFKWDQELQRAIEESKGSEPGFLGKS